MELNEDSFQNQEHRDLPSSEQIAQENDDGHPFATLSGWAARVFRTMPEYTCGKGERHESLERPYWPCGVDFVQLKSLFDAFDCVVTRTLRDAGQWLDGIVPEAASCTIDTVGDNDLKSPFVRRFEVETGNRIAMMGDLHGSVHSLLRNLLRLQRQGELLDNWEIQCSSFYLLFLGDLVDRGEYGVEVWVTIMRLFVASPSQVLLVRGNHEEKTCWQCYTMKQEIGRKFRPGQDLFVTKMFMVFCERLPHAIFMARNPDEASIDVSHQVAVESVTADIPSFPLEVVPPKGYDDKEQIRGKGKSKGKCKAPQHCGKNKGVVPHWRAKLEASKPTALIQKRQPLKCDWVQCCHGGIEPRFDPRPLLRSCKQFAVTGLLDDQGNQPFQGLNWSDWTGKSHSSDERFSVPNYGRGGFLTDIPDTNFYIKHVGIRAFFRGHQDDLCCLKLVVQGHGEVVKWETLLENEHVTRRRLATEGVAMQRFLNMPDTVPVFTFSSAAEGKHLVDEGFGIVCVKDTLAEWIIRAFIYDIQRREDKEENWVSLCGQDENGELMFTWA